MDRAALLSGFFADGQEREGVFVCYTHACVHVRDDKGKLPFPHCSHSVIQQLFLSWEFQTPDHYRLTHEAFSHRVLVIAAFELIFDDGLGMLTEESVNCHNTLSKATLKC